MPSRSGIYSTEKAAREMGVDARIALFQRTRFLEGEISRLRDEIEELVSDDRIDPVALALTNDVAAERLQVMVDYARELRACKLKMRDVDRKPKDEITDEMIDRARNYPIERLVQFDRSGKALAWCHPDKRPSLSWHKKANRAHCFPCGKSFDPIAVLMERDGMTFQESVRRLAGDNH